MPFVPRSEPARQHLSAAHADALLAKVEALEELAAACESEAVPSIRDRLAARYRALIGVEPRMRTELRARLQAMRVSGSRSVQDIIESLPQSKRDWAG